MISRINIFNIIRAHWNTFRNISKQKRDWAGLILMFFFPAAAASLLFYTSGIVLYNHISDLLTFVSIIGGFLFNLLAIIHTILEKVSNDPNSDVVRKLYAKEIHANIAFGILVALITSFLLVLSFFECPDVFQKIKGFNVLGWALYFFLILFLLNLLLILKKIFIVLDNP